MECIYLIGSKETSLYKIGVTRQHDIKKRLENIQVGCPYKVEVIEVFESENPYKVEKIIHRSLKGCKEDANGIKLRGEWFYLGLEFVYKFKDKCILHERNYLLTKSFEI